MPVPALLLVALAQAVTPSTPITVRGHQWAPFISPMGEPYRAHTATDDTLADWFYRADKNRDGVITADEMVADAERFFATLDTNHDGQIDPDELSHYEYEIAPDIQVMSRTERVPGQPAPVIQKTEADDADPYGDRPRDRDRHRDGRKNRRDEMDASLGIGNTLQGAARYSLLNIPEPVAAADTDFNRAVTLEEFRQAAIARFQLLDSTHQGRITLAQLEALPHAPSTDKHKKVDEKALDARIGNPLPTSP
jgi:Ca2+-binding EF-hand superfamily protein